MSEAQKFHQQSWFAWLMIFLFAPLGIFLMWKYKHHNIAARVVVSSIFGFYCLMLFIGLVNYATMTPEQKEALRIEQEQKLAAEKATKEAAAKAQAEKKQEVNQSNDTKQSVEPKKEEPQVKKEEKPIVKWPNVELNEQNIIEALKQVKDVRTIKLDQNNLKKIEIKDNMGTDAPNDKIVHIYIKHSSFDETFYAKEMSSTIASYSEILFKHPDMESIVLWGLADFTDDYGKQSENTAIRIQWNKLTSEKVDYKNFKDLVMGDYTKAYVIADGYFFHPAVYNSLKDKKNLLSQYSKE